MGLVSCNFCGNKVANQSWIKCTKCGAKYERDWKPAIEDEGLQLGCGLIVLAAPFLLIGKLFGGKEGVETGLYVFLWVIGISVPALIIYNICNKDEVKGPLDQNQLPTPPQKSPKEVITKVKTSYNPNRPTSKNNKPTDSNKTSTKQGNDYIEGFY